MFILDGENRIPLCDPAPALPEPPESPPHTSSPPINQCLFGDCRASMRDLIAAGVKVQTVVTSPPYFGLRDYGTPGQLGLEQTPAEYVANLVEVFRLVRQMLTDDGVVWLNLGDSYTSGGMSNQSTKSTLGGGKDRGASNYSISRRVPPGLKPKDLIGIPWRVAFALQEDGWYLRQDIIWCLSGGTLVYARTQKGDMPMTIKDLARLDPATVRLWNGEKWTQLLGMSKSKRRGDEIEIVLRSGERISCTPTHRFPTTRGLLDASDIVVGDVFESCALPEPESPKDCAIDLDAAWFAGLYLAEGSRSGNKIQISGHIKETDRWDRVQRIAAKFGGSASQTVDGNNRSIRVYGNVLNAIVDELVSGRTAIDKGFAPVVWRYSNAFVAAMVDGYLSGDGHLDGNRWRLGFCRNYNLERDLRTACARLGYTLTLNLSSVPYNGKDVPTFRGELRKARSGHHSEKDRNEVVEIRKARCRHVYDLGVADDPHLFALASGVLTHNSKPNPMPESVTDRCTKAHEYIFMLTKNARYYYDNEAIKEPAVMKPQNRFTTGRGEKDVGYAKHRKAPGMTNPTERNRRSVWTVSTKGYSGAHFAVFPADLIEPCVLAASRPGDTVFDPFLGSGTTAVVARRHNRHWLGCELNPEYGALQQQRLEKMK
jgi:DNA modification methylase